MPLKKYKYRLTTTKIRFIAVFVLVFTLLVLSMPVTIYSFDETVIGGKYLGPSWSTPFGRNIKGSPSLVDLDRDGNIEVIALTNNIVFCLNNEGIIIWSLHLDTTLSGKINFADLDEDGKIDLLIVGESSLICVDFKGSILWEYIVDSELEDFTPCIFDIDNDMHLDIIVTTAKTTSQPFVLNRKGKLAYYFNITLQYSGYWTLLFGSAPIIADIDNNDVLDILLIGNDYKLHSFTTSGEEKWISRTIRGDSLIGVADLDGDSTAEIIVGSTFHLYCFDHNGEIEWSYTQELQNNRSNIMNFNPCIADIDNDGSLEVISSAYNPLTGEGNIFCLNETGQLQWRYNSTNILGSPCAVDIDNDKTLEILFGEGNANFVGLNHLGELLLFREVGGIHTDPPLVADIDKDGKLEVIISRVNKKDIHCFELFESANSTSSWWTYGGSFQRHGSPDSDGDFLNDFAEINLYNTDPYSIDSDGDLLLDSWEVEYFLDPLENSTYDDPDKDGFTNIEEFERASNPNKWDNWARLYGGYLIPAWLLILGVLVYSYIKLKALSPKIWNSLVTVYIYLRVQFARDITKQRELYITDRDFFGDVEEALKDQENDL